MDELKMKYGTINCTCGQQFYFETAANHVHCINCDKDYDVSHYPINDHAHLRASNTQGEVEEIEFTEEPQNGTEGE